MASYLCPKCERRFPRSKEFGQRCPACNAVTTYSAFAPTVDLEEARSLARRGEFDRRYERHMERRKAMGYPDPEEVGRIQAKREVKVILELERAYKGEAA